MTPNPRHLRRQLVMAGAMSALGLLGMTLVIQIFVFPEAWWQVHIVWVSMALILIVRGGGKLSVDQLLNRAK